MGETPAAALGRFIERSVLHDARKSRVWSPSASLSRSNRRGLAVVRWKGVNLNGAWRVRKLVAVEPSSGCHTRAPESNRSESLLEAPLRRAILEAVQVDRTESFFGSGAEWRRVRYGPQ